MTTSAAAGERPPMRPHEPATRGRPWLAVSPPSTTMSARAGRQPKARIPCSRPNDLRPVHDSPLSAGPPRKDQRRRRRGRGGGTRALPAAQGRALRARERALDRAHAAPPARVGGGVAARTPRGLRRRALSRRAAGAVGGRRVRPPASARQAAGRRAPRSGGPARPEGGARRARALVPAGGEGGGRLAAGRRRGTRRPRLHEPADPRPADPLGQLFHLWLDELQLAAAPGAAPDPRLRDRARGGSSRRAGPLAPLLVAARGAVPGLARARALAPQARAPAPPRLKIGRAS